MATRRRQRVGNILYLSGGIRKNRRHERAENFFGRWTFAAKPMRELEPGPFPGANAGVERFADGRLYRFISGVGN